MNCSCNSFSLIIRNVFYLFLIEINTLPGMTEMSLFPDAARYAGIDFPTLVDNIVKYALEN